MLRGGAFKPRTSPFAFKGLGAEALEILAEARAETGLPVVTELLDTQHAEAIAEHADVVQIGARNMQNYALLEVAGKLGKPVLLKRGLSSSLDELLQAADYILKEGNEAVILCERGIRTFETATRFTLDLGAVPWLKLHTHLPVIVDPRTPRATGAWSSRSRARPPRSAPTGSSSRSTRTPRRRCATARRRSTPSHFADYARDVAAHAALLGKTPGLAELPAGELPAQGGDLGDGQRDVGDARSGDVALEVGHVELVRAEARIDGVEALDLEAVQLLTGVGGGHRPRLPPGTASDHESRPVSVARPPRDRGYGQPDVPAAAASGTSDLSGGSGRANVGVHI